MTSGRDTVSHARRPELGSSAAEFDEFIYILSHDIRASVRATVELPQWIEEDLEEAGVEVDAPLAEKFELLHTHMHRIDRMLCDLLEYSRVGRMQAPACVNLAEVLETVLQKHPLPDGFTLDHDLQCRGPFMGRTDAERLLGALLSNAVKHHDRESGRIGLRALEGPGQCVLTISDDGPGIPEKHRETVFNPMKMLKSRDELEGSGMGLTIVRKIVQHYGGALSWIMPAGRRGAALEMCLPSQ